MKPEELPFVCETLLPDVMVHKVHHNDCSYVRDLNRSTFTMQEFRMVGGYTEDHKTDKIKKWVLPGTIC